MKNSTKILLIVAACLILLGCGLAAGAAVLTPGGFPALIRKMETSSYTIGWTVSGLGDWDNDYSPDNRYEVDAPLSRLDIDWSAGSVTLAPYDGQNVVFQESSQAAFGAEHALRYGVKDGTLYIQSCRKGPVSNLPAKQLTVYIPGADFFRSIKVDSASAGIYAQGLKCEAFDADTASGSIDLDAMRIATAELSSTSGDITLILAEDAERADLSTVSGCIKLSGNVRTFDADSTSGELELEGDAQNAQFSTISGTIRAAGEIRHFDAESTSGRVCFHASADAPEELEISTVSGEVELALPESADFTLDFDTVSGDFDSELSVSLKNHRYICGSGSADYEVETASGSLYIKRNG